MPHGIGLAPGGLFERLDTCPAFCEGHADCSVTQHGTPLDFFGTDGPVVVNQRDGEQPMVCLVDVDTPYHELTPPQARIVALQLLQAADLAERYSQSLPATDIARQLAVLLAA